MVNNQDELLIAKIAELEKLHTEHTREIAIEAALDEIRARSMSMNKSEELWDVVAIVFKKFQEMNFSIDGAAIIITKIEGSRDVNAWLGDAHGQPYSNSIRVPYYDSPSITDIMFAIESGMDYFSKTYGFEEKNHWFKYAFENTDLKILTDDLKNWILEQPYLTQAYAIGKYSSIGLHFHHQRILSDTEVEILKRFSRVFDQAYIRFLDLKKAEEQARESQIQLAMERVRARTMAMQKSDELADVAEILFKQVRELGIHPWSTGFNIWLEGNEKYIDWITDPSGGFVEPYTVDLTSHPGFRQISDAKKRGEDFSVFEFSGDQLTETYELLTSFAPKQFAKMKALANSFPTRQFNHYFFGAQVGLMFITPEPHPEDWDIFKRFGQVFEQTYTRFLDLKKAEAQARESQIQLAMERVRARTMAMQNSDELPEAATLMFQQIKSLGIHSWSCGFNIWGKGDKSFISNMSGQEGKILDSIEIPLTEEATFIHFQESRNRGDKLFIDVLEGEVIKNHYKYFKALPGIKEAFDAQEQAGIPTPTFQINHLANFSHGNLMFITYESCPEGHDIFIRFAKVFEQTYTRFLDLQKAEAQAREAKIEAALERVRSRTMAMHKPDELLEAAELVHKELSSLGITSMNVSYAFVDDEEKSASYYSVNPVDGKVVSFPFVFPHTETEVMRSILSSWKKQKPFHMIDMDEDATLKHQTYIGEHILKQITKNNASIPFSVEAFLAVSPKKAWIYTFNFTKGYLFNIGGVQLTKAQEELVLRFTKVFNQTYTRFLDLQKAEAQAKEAMIEAALERVRSKTMAMHNSQDVGDTVVSMFDELVKLEVKTNRCGILIYSKSMIAEVWTAKSNLNEKATLIIGKLDLTMHPLLQGIYHAWENKESVFTYPMIGDDLISYYQAINNTKYYRTVFDLNTLPSKEFHTDFFFAEGSIFSFTDDLLTEEATIIFKRFAGVFGQTYRRYLDLQKAEAQTREAQIETALERVRSRTLAMQKSEELAETAVVVFKQLINLGIEPNRLYIGIIKEDNNLIEFWITDEDGSKVITQFTADANKNGSMKKMYESWKEQEKSLTIEMQGKELAEYFQYLSSDLQVPFKQGLSQKKRIQNIAFFGKGFIGMASPEVQPEESIHLLERFAAVFNLTYTRFNDLQIAEHHAEQAELDLIKLQTEKKRAEDALKELRSTQTQLIQSEKMASLGELTAGIAHEIQNPLNFVNNFSEVSTELIDEMNEEIQKGNLKEAELISNDLKENLSKINHHGKRAGEIVRSMLQHSRSSSGQKEPTDINALADEYLRLAYHGLRAKDKSFNATMHTDFNQSIGMVNIIPQDIGRVILNLITNAFYVVNEKKKNEVANYEPTVTINTTKSAKNILISVCDNGNGIPKNILDKIFQPFFTTKPTGQGTGLGLSLSYDIVKAHGGELRVETKEGEGSVFIIQLPID